MARPLPEPTAGQVTTAVNMRREADRGWYTGDMESLQRYGARRVVDSRAEPELVVSLLLTKDKMHHSVGWWRNAEYEFCIHASFAALTRDEADRHARRQRLLGGTGFQVQPPQYEEIPELDLRTWAVAIFGEHVNKVWFEPGGTDPRLTKEEAHGRSVMKHLRLFLDPETFEPFIPKGEVYHLTRWIPGLTPEKVDR
jgi:hypothetical protein